MDTSAVMNSLIGMLTGPGFGIGGCLAVALGVFVWRRTRSTHLLMARLWGLFNGKRECSVSSIKTYLDEQSAVMQFRFFTGLRVRTLKHIDTLVAWGKDHNEDIGDVAACGPYFDLERPGLREKIPGGRVSMVLALIATALLIGALYSAAGVFYNRALLQMKESGTWFSIDTVTAKTLSSRPAFRLDRCTGASVVSRDTGFTEADVKSICAMSTEAGTPEYLRSTIHGQKTLFGVACLYFLFLCSSAFAAFLRCESARKMKRRLELS